MNILHIGCPYMPYKGGSTVRLRSLVTRYCEYDYIKLYLATPSEGLAGDNNFPFIEVYRDSKVNNLKFSAAFFLFLIKNKPNVVVIHNSRALLKWLLWYKLFFSAKVVVEIHSFREESRMRTLLNGFLYKFVSAFVVLSTGSAKELKQRYGIADAQVIYNGIDIDKKALPKKPMSFVSFGYLGSFHDWQGVVCIAQAAKLLGTQFWDNNKLVLVGGGPSYNRCLDELGGLVGHPNILVKGWVSPEEAEKILTDIDYLLAPRPSNLATETVVPLKVVESINYQVPLIISNVGGLTELLDNKSAIIMKDNSAAGLAEAMHLASSRPDYNSMRSELATKGQSINSWEVSASQYVNLFNKLCSSI